MRYSATAPELPLQRGERRLAERPLP
jgi:hypothetical protein